MNAVVLGGTRGMGRAVARALAERGDRVFLLGRDEAEMARSTADLEVRRKGTGAGHALTDLEDPSGFQAGLDAAWAAFGRVDIVVVTAGAFGTQEQLEADPERLARLLTVNLTNTILLCEQVKGRLLGQGGGTLCVFSSVAGDRGRKPVGLYGASKAGLSHYLEALDHKYRSAGLITVCVKPGFVKTGMTEGLKPPPFAGEPDEVAARVVKAIDKGWPVVYAPPMWALVMWIIRRLPRFVMRRVGF